MAPQSSVSRADLLRCLQVGLDTAGAALLGFERQSEVVTEPRAGQRQNTAAPESLIRPAVRTAVRRPRYWYLHRAESLSPEQLTGSPPMAPAARIPTPQPAATAPQPLRCLSEWQVGDWQNMWDQHLPGALVPGRIDLPATVRRLAQGRPYRGWQRRTTCRVQHLLVLFERSAAIRPIWSELPPIWRSLRQQLGAERLTGYYLPAGLTGPALIPETGRGLSQWTVPAGASVLLIGTFGALRTGQMSPDWHDTIRWLQRRGHPLQLLSWCPLQPSTAIPPQALVPQPSCRVASVLAALSQAWLPELAQLRLLRRAVPGASLLDELHVYQHADVHTEAGWLWLRPEALPAQLRAYAALPAATRQRIEQAVRAWQSGLGQTARELDQLQRNLLQQPQMGEYANVHDLAQRVARELPQCNADQPPSQAYRLLRTLLPLAESLADDPVLRADWSELLQVAQQIALATGQRLPLQQQGLSKAPHWLTQYHQGVRSHVAQPVGRVLLVLDGAPYDVARRQAWDGELDPAADHLVLRDQAQQYELRALTKPDWAEHIACDADGIQAMKATDQAFVWRETQPGAADWSWVRLEPTS